MVKPVRMSGSDSMRKAAFIKPPFTSVALLSNLRSKLSVRVPLFKVTGPPTGKH